MTLPPDDEIRDLVRSRYVAPGPDLRGRVRASLATEARPKRGHEWLAVVAVALLALAAIGTFTTIRLLRPTVPAEPVVAGLTGVIVALDFRPDGSGWVVTQETSPKPVTAYWTGDAGRSWHRALALPAGSVGYLRSFGPDKAVLTYFPTPPGFKQAPSPDQGVLYVTTDAGRSWASNPLPAAALSTTAWAGGLPPSSGAINFLSPQDGWFSGRTPSSPLQLFRTQNGGRTWVKVSLPPELALGTVFFKDSLTAIAAVPPRQSPASPRPPLEILVTHDGGKIWTRATLPLPPADSGYPGFGAGLESVTWPADRSVEMVLRIGVGSMGVGSPEELYVYRSGDGGATWLPPILAWSGKAYEGVPLAAVLATDRWVVVAGRRVTVAAEKGTVVKESGLPLAAPYQAEQLEFADATHGFISAGPIGTCTGSCGPVILATSDGGVSWQQMPLPPASAARTSSPLPSPSPAAPAIPSAVQLSAAPGGVVWALVDQKRLFRSIDGGGNWEERPLPTNGFAGAALPFGEISFADDRHGWLLTASSPGTQCTDQGTSLWSTADAGATWQKLPAVGISDRQCKERLSFADSTHGFLDAWDDNHAPVIYRTADGGRTWSASQPLPDPPGFTTREAGFTLRAGPVRSFGSTLLVEATGSGHGYVFRSSDGGASWTYAATLPGTGLSIAFATLSRWVQIGPGPGLSQETTDSGRTWHPFSTDYSQAVGAVPAVMFADSETGYLTIGGGISRSVDGGAHWTAVKAPQP